MNSRSHKAYMEAMPCTLYATTKCRAKRMSKGAARAATRGVCARAQVVGNLQKGSAERSASGRVREVATAGRLLAGAELAVRARNSNVNFHGSMGFELTNSPVRGYPPLGAPSGPPPPHPGLSAGLKNLGPTPATELGHDVLGHRQ